MRNESMDYTLRLLFELFRLGNDVGHEVVITQNMIIIGDFKYDLRSGYRFDEALAPCLILAGAFFKDKLLP